MVGTMIGDRVDTMIGLEEEVRQTIYFFATILPIDHGSRLTF